MSTTDKIRVLHALAEGHLRAGRPELGYLCISEALELDPAVHGGALLQLRALYAHKPTEMKKRVDMADGFVRAGRKFYSEEKDDEAAVVQLTQALALYRTPGALFYRSMAYENMGRINEALADLDEANQQLATGEKFLGYNRIRQRLVQKMRGEGRQWGERVRALPPRYLTVDEAPANIPRMMVGGRSWEPPQAQNRWMDWQPKLEVIQVDVYLSDLSTCMAWSWDHTAVRPLVSLYQLGRFMNECVIGPVPTLTIYSPTIRNQLAGGDWEGILARALGRIDAAKLQFEEVIFDHGFTDPTRTNLRLLFTTIHAETLRFIAFQCRPESSSTLLQLPAFRECKEVVFEERFTAPTVMEYRAKFTARQIADFLYSKNGKILRIPDFMLDCDFAPLINGLIQDALVATDRHECYLFIHDHRGNTCSKAEAYYRRLRRKPSMVIFAVHNRLGESIAVRMKVLDKNEGVNTILFMRYPADLEDGIDMEKLHGYTVDKDDAGNTLE